MLEVNFIKHLQAEYPDIPVYSFCIPEDAPAKAFCFENAGYGIATPYKDGEKQITARTIKLTLSSKNITDIYDTGGLNKYIVKSSKIGDLPIISARILNFSDTVIPEQKIYERTFTIQFKFIEV